MAEVLGILSNETSKKSPQKKKKRERYTSNTQGFPQNGIWQEQLSPYAIAIRQLMFGSSQLKKIY
jgi:hypothetical protein